MPRKRDQLRQPDSPQNPEEVLSRELRGWIEQVIVPILVEQYLREKRLQGEPARG